MDSWVEPVYLANCLDGLNRVLSGFFLASGNREGEAVHDDVLNPHFPIADQGVNQPGGNPDLVFASSRLTLLIDGQCDYGCAVFANQRHALLEPGIWSIAIFEVH